MYKYVRASEEINDDWHDKLLSQGWTYQTAADGFEDGFFAYSRKMRNGYTVQLLSEGYGVVWRVLDADGTIVDSNMYLGGRSNVNDAIQDFRLNSEYAAI